VTAALKVFTIIPVHDTSLTLKQLGTGIVTVTIGSMEAPYSPSPLSDSLYDLPVYMKIVQANRHDSVTTIFALRDIHSIYHNLTFKYFIADGAMDNYPTYDLLNHYNMIPFIALDSRDKLKFEYPHPDILCFDNKGRPICPDGIPYQNWGYSKPKGIKYRCWFACRGQ
jgi:hypothetical protein